MSLSKMTPKQRILAALKGEEVDTIPWCPFLAYWWEAQPKAFQDRGQPWFFKEIGADTMLRGFYQAFNISYEEGFNVIQKTNSEFGSIQYITPTGTLSCRTRYSPDGNTYFVVEHPIKHREDYRILRDLIQHMHLIPNYQPLQEAIDQLGEDGLVVALVSPFGKSPFQSLIEHYVGTEELIYHLADFPEEVVELLEIMSEKAYESVCISVESPAQAFITWEDSSTTNISPSLFRTYIAPDMNRWGKVIHEAGKILMHHACGHVRALLPTMAEEEIDVIESLSPPPTGNVEIWEAQEKLSPRVGIVGGIEPTRFLYLNIDELTRYVEELLDKVNPHHYILANSDSCPPGVSIEKFQRVTQIVRSWKL